MNSFNGGDCHAKFFITPGSEIGGMGFKSTVEEIAKITRNKIVTVFVCKFQLLNLDNITDFKYFYKGLFIFNTAYPVGGNLLGV